MAKNLLIDDPLNEAGQRWDGDPYRVYRTQKVARALLAALAPEGTESALEVGACTGASTMIMAQKLGRIVAMDPMPGMLGILEEKLARLRRRRPEVVVEMLRGAAPADLPAECYDLIYSVLLMHHIEDVPTLLAALAEHVRPGGRVAIADLDREDGEFHYPQDPCWHKVCHPGFERDTFAGWLRDAGFVDPVFSTAFTVRRVDEDEREMNYPIFLAVARKPETAAASPA